MTQQQQKSMKRSTSGTNSSSSPPTSVNHRTITTMEHHDNNTSNNNGTTNNNKSNQHQHNQQNQQRVVKLNQHEIVTTKFRWYTNKKVLCALFIIIVYGISFAYFIVIMTQPPALEGTEDNNNNNNSPQEEACQYRKVQDVTMEELYPRMGIRHMVDPPKDTDLSLVCCTTTVGSLNILVHHSWAPIGAQRFLDMVTNHYFDDSIPFMRCIKNFICQFGLGNKSPMLQRNFASTIQDEDTNWLPSGPTYQHNSNGTKRYAQGYMAYAGSGPNSRSNQLIIALSSHKRLGGGSPWEIPFGEVVGTQSFVTLSKIYTGYGENGPTQASLHKEEYIIHKLFSDFPQLDYMKSCTLVDRFP